VKAIVANCREARETAKQVLADELKEREDSTTKDNRIPITYEQAISCLNIKPEGKVHSFLHTRFLAGADLDFARVNEMVRAAAAERKLLLSDELGGALRHDIAAWDWKYQEWCFLECDAKKVKRLVSALS